MESSAHAVISSLAMAQGTVASFSTQNENHMHVVFACFVIAQQLLKAVYGLKII